MKPFAHTAAVVGCVVVLLVALAQPPAQAQVPQQFCGNEGESLCGPADGYPYFCDTGLLSHLYTFRPDICGCALRLFGHCVLAIPCARCTNYTRRQPTVDLLFKGGWADWALKNQRELAQDEPLNWVMYIGTHNSYNTIADGHALIYFPNQYYSMTDQLRAGARLLTLDLYHLGLFGLDKSARLCHSFTPGVAPEICALLGDPLIYGVFPPSFRYYANGIKEIRNWLEDNPNEIVILDFEDYDHAMGGPDEAVLAPIRAYLGDMVFRPPPVPATTPSGVFPDRWPTRREMLSAGKRVIVIDNHYQAFDFAQQDPVTKTYRPSEFLFSEHETVAGTFDDGTWLAKNQRRFPDCFKTPDFDTDFHKTLFTKATIVVEERELGITIFGLLSDSDIESATECNYALIVLDKFSQLLDPLDPEAYTQIPDFHRQARAVWSWKEGDRGQNGDCAMLEVSSERWISANCGNQARYVCARPRSQSGMDPLDWSDPLGDDWHITTASGPWGGGFDACKKEFPPGPQFGPEGDVFGVPVNGYQNRRLKDAVARRGDVWLNYKQTNGDDRWVIENPSMLLPPVAKAGPDRVAECGSRVNLDGEGSYPRDHGLSVSYKWQGAFGTRLGQIVNLDTPRDLPLGANPIALTVTDSHGQTATDSLVVTVKDTTPPTMALSLQATYPASPRPSPVPVTATITAQDSCDSDPRVQLVSIVSNNPTPGDVQPGADEFHFKLGAPTEGKTYTVTYSATDLSGNSTQSNAQIKVVKKPW